MIQLPLQLPDDVDPHGLAVDYLTIAEAARSVRCCDRTIRRAIDRGALRAGRIRGERGSRGGFRIRPADLEEWMFSDGS